jgi:hypothetical protein
MRAGLMRAELMRAGTMRAGLMRALRRGLVLLLVVVLGGCGGQGVGRPLPDRAGPLGGGAVRAPDRGAYLGAWVRPVPGTQAGRVASVAALQQQLGRPLDIVHTYRKWTDPAVTDSDRRFAGGGAILLYSWAGTDTRDIVSGRYDAQVRARAAAIRALGRPVLLEWRWEMDRPNLAGEVGTATEYVAAWTHLRALFAAVGATNASWVWCPTADGFGPGGDAATFYPGDAQVDWLCADAYPGPHRRSFAAVVGPFLDWAAGHAKPVVIGEYGAPDSWGSTARAGWLRAATATIKAHPQIRAACYYDSDPVRDRPVENYALEDDPAALDAFTAMARDPYFNPAGR